MIGRWFKRDSTENNSSEFTKSTYWSEDKDTDDDYRSDRPQYNGDLYYESIDDGNDERPFSNEYE